MGAGVTVLYGALRQVQESDTYVWSVSLLDWVPMTQPTGGGGGGGTVDQGASGTDPWLITGAVTGPLTDTQLRASAVEVDGSSVVQPVSGTVSVSGAVAVTGPLTDAELRATPVPVSGTIGVSGSVAVTGPLTDVQLRASAVPVDGSGVTQPVSGTVSISGSVAVTGPLTDTQLRATPVPVSGTVTATGPLTDAQLRATAVPVDGSGVTQPISASSLPLPTNAAKETGGNLATLAAVDFATEAKQDIGNASLATLAALPSTAASSPTASTVGVASAQAVASNANRKGIILTLTSSGRVSLGIGATAVLDSGITLFGPGGAWTMTEKSFSTAAINAIGSVGSLNLAIQEFT